MAYIFCHISFFMRGAFFALLLRKPRMFKFLASYKVGVILDRQGP
jgi:Sec-independent protein secretion pathway component TatC